MKTGYRILLKVFIILTVSGIMGYESIQLLESLFHYRSPLRNNPPVSGDAFDHPLTERVVIILLDGLREDTANNASLMPELDRLRTQGASASMTSRPPSYSEPGYTTILTGAWPDINDGPAFNLEYEDIPAITQETIFTTSKSAGLKTAISAYYWFEKLIPQDQVDLAFYTPRDDREGDRQVVEAALPWLCDESINLFLIHIDQIDYASHYEGGVMSSGWNKAARQSDALLEELVAGIDLSTTTLLIFSDHGQIDQGGHGGHDLITLQEPFVATGAGILPGVYDPIQMVDLAPTIAILLGTSLPSSAEGRPLVDILAITESQKQAIATLHHTQQANLIESYAVAIGAKETDLIRALNDSQAEITMLQINYLSRGRLLRTILTGLMLGVFLYFSYKSRSTKTLPMLAGSIVFLLIFHILYSLITGLPYSFSIITSPESFILDAVFKTVISYLLAAIITGILVRIWRETPSSSVMLTLRFTALVVIVAGAPSFWYLILYGTTIQTILPDIGLLFRGMLSLIQVMTVGLSGLILTGISAAIYALIVHDRR
jgi:hypothetical protein